MEPSEIALCLPYIYKYRLEDIIKLLLQTRGPAQTLVNLY